MITTQSRRWQHSTSPDELVSLLGGADSAEWRGSLEEWVLACRRENDKNGSRVWPSEHSAIEYVDSWSNCDRYPYEVPMPVRADLLRCCIPGNPFAERVECPECDGEKWIKTTRPLYAANQRDPCPVCSFTGSIPAKPLIEPTWLTSSVVDLAGVIRGGQKIVNTLENEKWCSRCWAAISIKSHPDWDKECPFCFGKGCVRRREPETIVIPPDFSRMPILADALMDAGCDDETILNHCRQPTHTSECWVIRELTKGR